MDKTIKLACLLAIIIFSSCASRKDFVYLQDMDELQEYPMVQKYEAIIHRDDRLSIIVNSKNPELSLPFNMSGSRSYSVEADGSISNNEVGVLSDEKEVPAHTGAHLYYMDRCIFCKMASTFQV